jgi:DNA processing protein
LIKASAGIRVGEMSGHIDIQSQDYPCLLKEIRDPPTRLYYKGNFCTDIFSNCVSVVGSRNMSEYGRRVIDHIFSTLDKSITIVSGFMTGVDAEAHKKAIKYGLKTIAVLPCGIDCIHPSNQTNLYNEILCTNGLILSEYPHDIKPEIWTYPRRDRIVAGLSKLTLVIEAASNSGSLITARLSNLYNRPVFVVPGSIFNPLSKGIIEITNEFAKTIDSGLCINEFLNSKTVKREESRYQTEIF